jgi:glycosyltransferase involved in cell wall biosynthesis
LEKPSKPKRILYIHGISAIGGAERDLLCLFERIDRQRFEPFVVCPPDGPLIREVKQLKVPVYPMSLPSWHKLKSTFFIPWAVWSLFKLIRDLKIDLVHVNEYWWGPISYIASRMAHVPCVVHIRQEIEPRRIKQYWFKKPDRMIAVSNHIRNVAIKSGVDPTHVVVIYSGINTSVTVSPNDGKKVRQQYQLTASQPVIGTVASLFPRKGHEYLLEALVEIRKKIPDIHCLIIGEGDDRYRTMLLEMVQVHDLKQVVTFTGFQQEVLVHIATMDIFVLPSVLEGFGIVLLEAMAMGKPVVATTVGGISEVVEDQVTGLLVPPKDSGTLAKKILYLLKNLPIGEKLGLAGRARVLKCFSSERMVSQLQNLYLELIL